MMVKWDKFTLVELKGLANYTVTYSPTTQSRKRQSEQGTVTVPWTSNNVTITNLRPSGAYDVSVGTVTTRGMSRKWCALYKLVQVLRCDHGKMCLFIFLSMHSVEQSGAVLMAEPTGIDGATIGGAIVAVVLVAILLVVIIIIIIFFVK